MSKEWLTRSVLGVALAAHIGACATTTQEPLSTSAAAAANAEANANADADADVVALRYAWPKGSAAAVEETVLKNGHTALERYRLRLVPVEGEPTLQDVVIDQLEMVSIDGDPIDTDEERARMAPVQQLAAAIPHVRIDEGGNVVDVVGTETMLETIVASRPEAEREQFRATMQGEAMKQIARAAGEKLWTGWVGGFNGLSVPPNEPVVAVTTLQGDAGPVDQETKYLLTKKGDHVVVEASTVTPPAVARAVMLPMFKELIPATATRDEALAMLEQMQFDIRSTVTAELDPSTLRPFHIVAHRVTRVTMPGKSEERVEDHDWKFNWQN